MFSCSGHLNARETVQGYLIFGYPTLPAREVGLEKCCDLPKVPQAACGRAGDSSSGLSAAVWCCQQPPSGSKSLLSNWSVTDLVPPTSSELRQGGGSDLERDPSPAQSTRTTPGPWIVLKPAFQQRPYPARPAELLAWKPLRAGLPAPAAGLERAVRSGAGVEPGARSTAARWASGALNYLALEQGRRRLTHRLWNPVGPGPGRLERLKCGVGPRGRARPST